MFFQHKKLFAKEGPVSEDDYVIPLGKAALKREGKDVSLLCYGAGYYLCLEAAAALRQQDIDAQIVDIRTLKPLDMETVSQSIRKTHRVVIVHEACVTGGFGAELAAPVKRVGAKDVPMPFSPSMEDFVLPCVRDVIAAVDAIMSP